MILAGGSFTGWGTPLFFGGVMNCRHCKTGLIWCGDHDAEEDTEVFTMVTNLSCPKCNSLVLVYSGVKENLPPARIELGGDNDGV